MSWRGEGDEVDGLYGDEREKKEHNGKERRGQQFPSINFSSVVTVCAEQCGAKQDCILSISQHSTCAQTNTGVYLAHKT